MPGLERAQDACWGRGAVRRAGTSVTAASAALVPEPASEEGGDAPEQTWPLIYPCMEQGWRKMEKTVQA